MLAADTPEALNDFDSPDRITPITSPLRGKGSVDLTLPPY
jgi:hypothetical protein